MPEPTADRVTEPAAINELDLPTYQKDWAKHHPGAWASTNVWHGVLVGNTPPCVTMGMLVEYEGKEENPAHIPTTEDELILDLAGCFENLIEEISRCLLSSLVPPSMKSPVPPLVPPSSVFSLCGSALGLPGFPGCSSSSCSCHSTLACRPDSSHLGSSRDHRLYGSTITRPSGSTSVGRYLRPPSCSTSALSCSSSTSALLYPSSTMGVYATAPSRPTEYVEYTSLPLHRLTGLHLRFVPWPLQFLQAPSSLHLLPGLQSHRRHLSPLAPGTTSDKNIYRYIIQTQYTTHPYKCRRNPIFLSLLMSPVDVFFNVTEITKTQKFYKVLELICSI